jgi:type IV secretory pathway TrbF-like protein
MLLRRSSVRYSTTPPPITPYQAAQQQWDQRIGSARVQAKNWRLMALGTLILAFVMAGGLLWLSTRSIVTPYVVEVDTQGSVRAVGPAMEIYRPTDAQIDYHLSRFLRNVRSIPIDPIVLRDDWLEAYDYATDRAAAELNDYARVKEPFANVGRLSIAIEVTSVVRASENSFQLRWIERTYQNGALNSTERWTAILSIVLQTPKDVARIRKNPLGIYVDGLDWSRELGNDSPSGESK